MFPLKNGIINAIPNAKKAKSPNGSTLFPGKTIANNKEIGTINNEVDITVGWPTVKAASIPMLTTFPFNFLEANSLAASATGINPSMNIATILGMIFITAAVDIAKVPIFATS